MFKYKLLLLQKSLSRCKIQPAGADILYRPLKDNPAVYTEVCADMYLDAQVLLPLEDLIHFEHHTICHPRLCKPSDLVILFQHHFAQTPHQSLLSVIKVHKGLKPRIAQFTAGKI